MCSILLLPLVARCLETIDGCIWNRPEEDLSYGKLASTHPSWTYVKSIIFFMQSSRSYAASLTHYSTEPLITRPDLDPLLLPLAIAGELHPNPGPPKYPCSFCFKSVTSQCTNYLCTRCAHWVHSRCSGIQNIADYCRSNGCVCTTCRMPPQPHNPLPHRLVPPTHTPCQTRRSTYYSGT